MRWWFMPTAGLCDRKGRPVAHDNKKEPQNRTQWLVSNWSQRRRCPRVMFIGRWPKVAERFPVELLPCGLPRIWIKEDAEKMEHDA